MPLEVDAPIEVSWHILTDLRAWPTWTPTLNAIRAIDLWPIIPRARYELRQPFQRPRIWEVESIEHHKAFAWRTIGKRGYRAAHTLDVRGATAFCRATLRPINQPRWYWHVLEPTLKRAVQAELSGFKNACEGLPQAACA